MHTHTKIAQLSIHLSTSLFFLVPCPCLSLLPYTPGLRPVWCSQTGALVYVSPPSGSLAWGCAGCLANGCTGAPASMGPPQLVVKFFCGLGSRISRRVSIWFGVRLLCGLLGSSITLLLRPTGQPCGMRRLQQMPLPPKHLLFPWVCHQQSHPPTTEVTTPRQTSPL